ncbi:hypothetical protein BT93_F3009 [Corymbia citriodora subsp. variegata]|nr:hypothetical protein BT93_F3009 [Corymbia citriodora subsp. variegata]
MSDGEETHWCHQCSQRFSLHGREVICPTCNEGFVEELTESHGSPTEEYFMPNSGDFPRGTPHMIDIMFALMRENAIGSRRGFRGTAGSTMRELFAGRNPHFDGRRHLSSVPEETRGFIPPTPFMSFHGQIPESAFLHHSRANGPMDIDFDHLFVGPELEEVIQVLSLNDQPGPAPAPPSAIDAMPTIKITQTHLRADADCPVCKEEFELGSEVRMMPCHHIYHSDCIIPWLVCHNSCPVCRFEMPAQGSDGGSHSGMGNARQTHGRTRRLSSLWPPL